MAQPQHVPLAVHDDLSDFAAAVRSGLAQPQKVIPARFFYDHAGSELFEAITGLPEYYPTRTEIGILTDNAADIAAAVGPGRAVIEFGSGSSAKTPLLLRAIAPAAYVPVDISAEFLHLAAAGLAADFPGLPVLPVAADFTAPFRVARQCRRPAAAGFLPGLDDRQSGADAAADRPVARLCHHAGGRQLAGHRASIWRRARPNRRRMLEAAYDDAQGVTAAFNLNLLHRINRELGGTIDVTGLRPSRRCGTPISAASKCISSRGATWRSAPPGSTFEMTAGEHIHTENSYKWTMPETRLLARASGWQPAAAWTDPDARFSLHLWQRDQGVMQP